MTWLAERLRVLVLLLFLVASVGVVRQTVILCRVMAIFYNHIRLQNFQPFISSHCNRLIRKCDRPSLFSLLPLHFVMTLNSVPTYQARM